jgi:DNA-directed RNA polymerase specialized sigma subunit
LNENDLSQYKAIKNEIADLEKRIKETKEAEVVLFGAAKGSSKYFPYTPQTFLVSGIDPADAAQRQKKISELLRQREVQRNELVKKQIEIERYIAEINDSTTRTIFLMYFLDGITQKQIADKTGYDQSIISRKIKGYIKYYS